MAIVYNPKVDWNADGDFSDALESLSAEVQKLVIEYGRDSDLDAAQVGTCRIVVRDVDGKYIPGNLSSAIVGAYGGIYPARPVQIDVDHHGTVHTIWKGKLDDVWPEPGKKNKKAILPCLDEFARLRKTKISIGLQENSYSGGTSGLVTLALVEAGVGSGQWVISSNQIDSYPLVYTLGRVESLSFLQDIEKSEYGFIHIPNDGVPHWEDYHTRLQQDRSTSSQWIITDDLYTDLRPTSSLKGIKNLIVLRAQAKTKAASEGVIATFQENAAGSNSPALAAGQTKTFWLGYVDSNGIPNIAGNVQDVASGDITGNSARDGSGSDRTEGYLSSITTVLGDTAKVQVFNSGAIEVFMTKLQVRGKIYTDQSLTEIQVGDGSSQLAYGIQELPLDLPYYINSKVMTDMGETIKSSKKEPRQGYMVELLNRTSSEHHQILARTVSDRVTVQSTLHNLSGDFFIEKVKHEVTHQGKVHKAWWTLSKADDDMYWIVDKSRLEQDATRTRYAFPTRVGR